MTRRAIWRSTLALVAGLALLVTTGPPAAAEPVFMSDAPVTYRDITYGTAANRPTGDKPQSKLWFQDGSWWAVMVDAGDDKVHIAELMPNHAWRMTETVVDTRATSSADVLWDGSKLYVASRVATAPLLVSRLSYDRVTRKYSLDAGYPTTASTYGSESATIDKDTTGRLWVTYTRSKKVWVAHTGLDQKTWTAPFVPPVPGTAITSDDISSLIAFKGKVGVMWSNQATSEFRFAVHVDGAPSDQWTVEVALSEPGIADDHINLKSVAEDANGRIYAAVKTSLADVTSAPPDTPLVLVLVREGTGAWRSVVAGTKADDHSRPIILVDETNQRLLFFATAPVSDGVIYYKTAPLSDLRFPTGRGEPFVQYKGKYVNNATSTKQPVNAATGVVVLASSGGTDRFYYHAEMAVGGGGAMDTQAPSVPAGLTGQATSSSSVGLSWSASTDNVGVVGYRVFRDGVLVGSPTSTSYTDSSLTAGTSYSYAVAAVDAANNVSARSAPVSVTTPAAPPASAGITFKGASAQANDTATSLSIASPPGASAGDVMLASVAVRGAPTITAPAGWTLVRLDAHATIMRQVTYVKVAAATEPTSYTWSFSSAQGAAGTVQAYSGVSQTQPVETSGGQLNEASKALTAPGVVATAGNLQVGLFSAATLTSVTPPVGMTERAEAATSAGRYKVTSEAADALTSTTGDTGAITAQASASAKSVGQVVILRAG